MGAIDAFQARPPILYSGRRFYTPGTVPRRRQDGVRTAFIRRFRHHRHNNRLPSSVLAERSRFFRFEFSLPACTAKNKCLEVHQMKAGAKSDSGWDMESALEASGPMPWRPEPSCS